MNRYLLQFSYIGSAFSNYTRIIPFKLKNVLADNTVIGAIESALFRLRPTNQLNVVTSSRTDVGVHALCNSVHVDLEFQNKKPCNSEKLTRKLNQYFCKSDIPIRILCTRIVPSTFHSRFDVNSRSYLYRLAVLKKPISEWTEDFVPEDADYSDGLLESYEKILFTQTHPIEELDRCYFRYSSKQFDIDRVKDAAQLFIGRHDFQTFMGQTRRELPVPFTIRTINSIDIVPGRPQTTRFNLKYANNHFNYWDIHINAKSFIYNQIRRIVGTLIAIGEREISKRDVYEMVTIPSKYSWKNLRTAPPNGLYLTKIEYD